MRASLILLALVTACDASSAPAGSPDFTSGARLRAHVLDGGEGARFLLGWHDADLDQGCRFHLATDGRWRCLPDDDEPRAGLTDGDIEYLDAACTQAVWVMSTRRSSTPRYVRGRSDPSGACDRDDIAYPVLELGDERSVTTPLHYSFGGVCMTEINPPDPRYNRVFEVGAPVDPALFVAAEVTDEAHGESLAARVLVGDDGSRQVVAIVDRASGEPCSFFHGRCVAGRAAHSYNRFGDDACTLPAAVTSPAVPSPTVGDCAPDFVIEHHLGSSCESTPPILHAPGARIAALYGSSEGMCRERPPGVGDVNVLLGAVLLESDLPSVGIVDIGTGRLRTRQREAGDGHGLLSTSAFLDTESDEDCTAARFCDGGLRCLHAGGYTDRHFADASCTQPLVLVYTDVCPGAVTPTHTVIAPASGADPDCIAEGAIVAVGALATPTAVWREGSSDECSPSPVDQGPGFAWYLPGAAIPSSTFAVVVDRIE